MSRPTVSVVIPAFNVGPTIDETLQSVAAQTRPPDEVVIVDDSSTDDSLERAKRWADRLPLVVVPNPTNVGCGAARARAIAVAGCDIIAPIDGDDVWLPDHLEALVPLAGDPSTIVATKPLTWQPERGLDDAAPPVIPLPEREDQPEGILRFNFLFSGSLAWREAYLAIGGGSVARRADDWENWIRLIIESDIRAVPAPHPTVLYRIHLGSLSVLDGCLPEELDLLAELEHDIRYRQFVPVIQAAARRRRARREFLAGSQAAERGETSAARRAFGRAIRLDPTLAGGAAPGAIGSVAIRALVGVVSPSLAVRARRRRLERQALLDPQPIAARSSTQGDGEIGDAEVAEQFSGGRVDGR